MSESKTVSLAQALKIKNRMVSEINRIKVIITRENSRRNDNPSKVDVSELFVELEDKITKLVVLKSSLAKANVGIYDLVNAMAELKSLIVYYQTLPVREGDEVEHGYGASTPVKYTWTATFNQSWVDTKVKELQTKIDSLQDKIDEFNAVNRIEVLV